MMREHRANLNRIPSQSGYTASGSSTDWHEDTIVAISTATGRGAIGIVRLSGPQALEIVRAVFRPAGLPRLPDDTHVIHYGHIVDEAGGATLDEVLVGVMRAPRSYTREDVVEINCHGGPVAQRAVIRLLLERGGRMAEPGEFTRRAFLNGRIDLAQAESVASIVAARSTGALRASLRLLEGGLSERLQTARRELLGQLASIEATVDFADEDVEEVDWLSVSEGLTGVGGQLARLLDTAFLGRVLEQGVRTAIVGRPNVGKSSLLNALLMRERAIVSDIPGTTRDTVEELMEIGGIPIHLVDTAGMRIGGDHVEQLGVQRSLRAMEHADLVLAVFDLAGVWDEADEALIGRLDPQRTIVVGSKLDLVGAGCEQDLLDRLRSISGDSGPQSSACVPGIRGAADSGADTHGWLFCPVSVVTGEGLERLRQAIQNLVTSDRGVHLEEPVLATERQRGLVAEALEATGSAVEGIAHARGEELICEDIRAAVQALGRITGEELTPDLIDEIFSRFCLGK